MDVRLPYFAGFDGEGSMNIYSNGAKRGRTLRAQLTQNVFPLSTELLAGVLDLVYRPTRPAEMALSAGEAPAT